MKASCCRVQPCSSCPLSCWPLWCWNFSKVRRFLWLVPKGLWWIYFVRECYAEESPWRYSLPWWWQVQWHQWKHVILVKNIPVCSTEKSVKSKQEWLVQIKRVEVKWARDPGEKGTEKGSRGETKRERISVVCARTRHWPDGNTRRRLHSLLDSDS